MHPFHFPKPAKPMTFAEALRHAADQEEQRELRGAVDPLSIENATDEQHAARAAAHVAATNAIRNARKGVSRK